MPADLRRALVGEIGMSDELDALGRERDALERALADVDGIDTTGCSAVEAAKLISKTTRRRPPKAPEVPAQRNRATRATPEEQGGEPEETTKAGPPEGCRASCP